MNLAKFQRLDLGLNVSDTATLARLTNSEVSLIENGRLRPTPAQLEKLAKALRITPPQALLFKMTAADFGAEVKTRPFESEQVPA